MVWQTWLGWTGWGCSAVGSWAFSSPAQSKRLGWTTSWWEVSDLLGGFHPILICLILYLWLHSDCSGSHQLLWWIRGWSSHHPGLLGCCHWPRGGTMWSSGSLILPLITAGPEEKATQICHKLLPPTTPGFQGCAPFKAARQNLDSVSSQDLDPPFCIQNAGTEQERIPTASTCMNLLKLPDYKVLPPLFWFSSSPLFQDRVVLKRKLIQAIESEAGFELS